MCGICGELRLDGQPPQAEILSRMNAKLERRGPDDAGLHITGPMGFGHRRLSVIALFLGIWSLGFGHWGFWDLGIGIWSFSQVLLRRRGDRFCRESETLLELLQRSRGAKAIEPVNLPLASGVALPAERRAGFDTEPPRDRWR